MWEQMNKEQNAQVSDTTMLNSNPTAKYKIFINDKNVSL